MALLATNNLTMVDVVSATNPDGSTAVAANILQQHLEFLDFLPMVEANGPWGHRNTVVTSLAGVQARAFNEGTTDTKDTTAQFDESIAMFSTRCMSDAKLVERHKDPGLYRMQMSKRRIEAMGQAVMKNIIFGNQRTNTKVFTGFGPRLSDSSAANAGNIIDADAALSGVSNCTSVYYAVLGVDRISGIYPQGGQGGLKHNPATGPQDVPMYTSAGAAAGFMRAYVDTFEWDFGINVPDWRDLVRIGSIQSSTVQALSGKQAPSAFTNFLHLFIQAMDKPYDTSSGQGVFIANREIHTALKRLALEKSSPFLTVEQAATQFGTNRSYLMFMGCPVLRYEGLTYTESEV